MTVASDPILAADGYPSDQELQRIRDWEISDGWRELMQYVHERWNYADAGYWQQWGDRFEISTAGWSGNEDILGAMQETFSGVFWGVCARAWRSGGHWVLDVRRFDPDGKQIRDPETPDVDDRRFLDEVSR